MNNTKFNSVQDYLDCDNRQITSNWFSNRKKLWTTELRKNKSLVLKKIWSDPKHKKRISEKIKSKWNDPEYRAKLLAQRNTPEYKKMVRDKRYGVNYVSKTKPKAAQ